MNALQQALIDVAYALDNMDELEYLGFSGEKRVLLSFELNYASEILREKAKGLEHKRPPGISSRPSLGPRGMELLDLMIRYQSDEYENNAALTSELNTRYPKAPISTIQRAATKIRKGKIEDLDIP